MTAPDLTAAPPLVVTTVGSDGHCFDRVIGWVDTVLAAAGTRPYRHVCQHGSSRPARTGVNYDFLDHEELQDLMGAAAVVICHGGPGTLMEALRLGRKPVAVPRVAALGEAVDDHQVAFCRFLADRREAVLPSSVDDLRGCVLDALEEPSSLRVAVSTREQLRADSVARFARALGGREPGRTASRRLRSAPA